MSEIPEDIQRAAADIMAQACLGDPWASNGVEAALQKDIARAILAERERCAKIAEEDCRTAIAIDHDYKPTWYVRAQKIAAAIRTPSTGKRRNELELSSHPVRA